MNFGKIGLILLVIISTNCKDQSNKSNQDPGPGKDKKWYKGNLHTHSYWSDGDEFPEAIMDWYKSNDYQFVALSDHNTLAEGDKWVTISEDLIYQNAFEKYLGKYGSDWVSVKIDSGRKNVKLKTLKEYRGLFEEDEKFLIIQSEEITDRFEDKRLHINATNIQEEIEPQGGNSVVEVLQNNIDQILQQRVETGVPMIPHINHPNFRYSISLADMIALKGEKFFEVYNGHHNVHNLGDSVHMSTERMWDLINISYLNDNKPMMFGLATDDSHHYHIMGKEWDNAGRGWIMIRASSLIPSSLIAAMEEGDFYASTGVELEEVRFEQNTLSIDIAEEEGVTYAISFIGCRKDKTEPEEFTTVSGSEAAFILDEEILFVRGKITSSKHQENPTEDIIYEMAWTQPVRPE